MPGDLQYYPNDGTYIPHPDTIFAFHEIFARSNPPNPCRKYHISADIDGAKRVADEILPFLAANRVHHKVVQRHSFLCKMEAGDQAGKFITLYMDPRVEHRNAIITEIAQKLDRLKKEHGVLPGKKAVRYRRSDNSGRAVYLTTEIEMPLDDNFFIYGGYLRDPSE